MSNGVSSSLAHYHQASYESRSLQQASLRRKSAHLWDGAQGAISDYPSPPMSSPPSPTRRPSDLTLPSTRSEQFLPVSTNPPLASSVAEHASQQIASPITTLGFTNPDVPAYHPTALFATGSGAATLGSATSAYPPTSYAPPPTIHQRTISQDARKTKTHVASACVNCKRAHLSCDVQRPCARCIASGKQDTCYDVAHKKRGRPRLRDESHYGVERSMPSANAPVNSTMPMTTPTRPIAATRQRRAESFRSIHSMTSEESSSYGPPTPSFLPRPPVPFQTPLSFPSPAYRHVTSPSMEPEVPTALLDLDFVILRANASFQQIMADDRDLTRSRLHEIAAPADSESFMSIRSRLRGEREARQPSYLPPIVSSGEDPLGGVLDRDVEALTRGFSDQTYTWVQLKSGPRGAQTFPARVRLAKAATYFAVVTLPSFRPIQRAPPPQPQQGPSMYPFGPPLPSAEEAMRQRRRQSLTHSAPPSMFQPTEMAHPQPRQVHRRAPSFSRNFPPLQSQYPSQASHRYPQPQHFHSPQPVIGSSLEPRFLPADPGVQAAPYGPPGMPSAASGPGPSRDTHLLPPMAASSARATELPTGPLSMPPLHETVPASTTGTRRISESDEDSEGRRLRSPRKRRRMGIDEVLQK